MPREELIGKHHDEIMGLFYAHDPKELERVLDATRNPEGYVGASFSGRAPGTDIPTGHHRWNTEKLPE